MLTMSSFPALSSDTRAEASKAQTRTGHVAALVQALFFGSPPAAVVLLQTIMHTLVGRRLVMAGILFHDFFGDEMKRE